MRAEMGPDTHTASMVSMYEAGRRRLCGSACEFKRGPAGRFGSELAGQCSPPRGTKAENHEQPEILMPDWDNMEGVSI
jgi:hypothetical protein